VRWLEGDCENGELFRECNRVPGFEKQLAAITMSERGEWPSAEAMLHSAGNKRLKAQYVREGGKPEDYDALMLAFLSGDEQRLAEAKRRVFKTGRRGCATVIVIASGIVMATLFLV